MLVPSTPHSSPSHHDASPQGHIGAAAFVGSIFYWGNGVPVDYPRAMAAYKVGAEGGDALCQYQGGTMYFFGQGVDVDYKQAQAWFEKAAAQDQPTAVGQLGAMYYEGKGVTPSWRRAREYYERAIELGDSDAVENMQNLTGAIQDVNEPAKQPLRPFITRARPHASTYTNALPLHARRPPPSWTSGWRSTARAART